MNLSRAVICLTSAVNMAGICHARPVSYPDGWTIMQRNNGDRSALHVHYSPTFKDSIGVYVERNWTDDLQFTGIQYNRLVKRWNGSGSQGNLYAKFGLGQADPFGARGAELSGFTEIAADWETRRWFTSYALRATDFAGNQSLHHSARLGAAPYIGDYGDLHTWFMLQMDNQPDAGTSLTTTPMVRFFKGVQMVELGYTIENKEMIFNWIVRF